MADAFTTALRLCKPEVAADIGTWGGILNAQMIDMIEEAVVGFIAISVTAGNVVLTANNGATDQARNAVLSLTGTPGAARTVTAPNVKGTYWVINSTTDGSIITFGAGGGTTVAIGANCAAFISTDGAGNAILLSIYNTFGLGLGTGIPTANGPVAIVGDVNAAYVGDLRNLNAGTTARAQWRVRNDVGGSVYLGINSSVLTNNSQMIQIPGAALLIGSTAAGLVVGHTSVAPIYFCTNNHEVGEFTAAGLFALGDIAITGPSAANYPALKRAGASMEFRLADDSAYTGMKAAQVNVTQARGLVLETNFTPATAATAGVRGQVSWDAGFIYICIAANTWMRAPLATW